MNCTTREHEGEWCTTHESTLLDCAERLRAALSRLVYEDRGRWLAGIHGDSDVSDIIGTLLEQPDEPSTGKG